MKKNMMKMKVGNSGPFLVLVDENCFNLDRK